MVRGVGPPDQERAHRGIWRREAGEYGTREREKGGTGESNESMIVSKPKTADGVEGQFSALMKIRAENWKKSYRS